MNTWVTADWHLGETRFDIMQRPFYSAKENAEVIIANHNRLIQPEDKVFVLGDAVYQNAPEYLEYVGRMNGIKILVRGNHDRRFSDFDLLAYFTDVVDEGSGVEYLLKDDANVDALLRLWLTHYPTSGRADCFNLVGHIHAAWKFQKNMINVGVDCNHFRPHNIKDMLFYYKAINEFYDDDVWCADSEINSPYNRRGKKGRYFNER